MYEWGERYRPNADHERYCDGCGKRLDLDIDEFYAFRDGSVYCAYCVGKAAGNRETAGVNDFGA